MFFIYYTISRPTRQAKKRASDGKGEIKIEPEEMIFAIMTDRDIYKYKTKEVFDEKLEEIKEGEKMAFITSQVFASFEDADTAYSRLMDHYNGLSDDEKKAFKADTVDLFNCLQEPPTKVTRTSLKPTTRSQTGFQETASQSTAKSTPVAALFTEDGAQYYADVNLAHIAFEEYKKEKKGSKVGRIVFGKFNSMKEAMAGYDNWLNKRRLTPIKKKATPTKVVESDEDNNDKLKESKTIDEYDPQVQALVQQMVEKELAKKMAVNSAAIPNIEKKKEQQVNVVTPVKNGVKQHPNEQEKAPTQQEEAVIPIANHVFASNQSNAPQISNLILASCATRSRIKIVVYNLANNVSMPVDKVLVTVDMVGVVRNGNDDQDARPYFGFKPKAFEMLVLEEKIASMLPEEFHSMKEFPKRQKPFGDNNMLIHIDKRNGQNYNNEHGMLTFFVKKEEGKDTFDLVTEALNKIGSTMLLHEVQKVYQDCLSIIVTERYANKCPPIEGLSNREMAQSIFVHFFAALKKADIKIKHNLRFNLPDEACGIVVKNFFPDSVTLPPENLWHQNLKNFAFGNE